MDNQHRQINGYRELSQAEIALMNEIKTAGPVIEALCAKVTAHVNAQYAACADGANPDELARLMRAEPLRWVQWAADGMQANLMYLTRAVAQPTFF